MHLTWQPYLVIHAGLLKGCVGALGHADQEQPDRNGFDNLYLPFHQMVVLLVHRELAPKVSEHLRRAR